MNNQSISTDACLNDNGIVAASELTGATRTWNNVCDFVAMALTVIYLIFLPSGIAGLGITTTALLVKFMVTNSTTRGIYMLYFGMTILGMISHSLGYPGIGGKVGLAIGLLILAFRTDMLSTISDLKAPLLWISWIGIVLILFYLYGPMTQYCTDKLIWTVINGILFLLVFHNLFSNPSADWFNLGQLGILSSYVFLAAGLIIAPELKPGSIFDIGIIRITFTMLHRGTDIIEINNNISFLASMGMMLMYAASPDRPLTVTSIFKMCSYIIFSAVILSWSSARLPIFSIVITAMLILAMKPLSKRRYLIIGILLFSLFIAYIIIGRFMDLFFIQDVFDSSDPFISRLNREGNWLAGYERFTERPWLGYGLGGYFIQGLTFPGWGVYAHNLFLELLSETGIIGSILIVGPIFFWRRLLHARSQLIRSQNCGLIFAIFTMVFLQTMVSFDLRASIALFAVIGAMAVAVKKKESLSADG